jgi:hypothetical protein
LPGMAFRLSRGAEREPRAAPDRGLLTRQQEGVERQAQHLPPCSLAHCSADRREPVRSTSAYVQESE